MHISSDSRLLEYPMLQLLVPTFYARLADSERS